MEVVAHYPVEASAPAVAPLAALATARGLTLIQVATLDPKAASSLPIVVVTKTELFVGSDRIADATPSSRGFPASIKRAGSQAALEVLPLEAALKPVHVARPDNDTIRLVLDAQTPYRSALEVLFTAARAGFTSFAFVVVSRGVEHSLPASTPSRAEQQAGRARDAPPIPSFVFQADGLSLSVANAVLGAGCVQGAASDRGVAVPSVAGRLDTAAIAACAAHVKTMSPALGTATAASVSASPELPMQTVLSGVAAILPSFPVIHFGLLSG